MPAVYAQNGCAFSLFDRVDSVRVSVRRDLARPPRVDPKPNRNQPPFAPGTRAESGARCGLQRVSRYVPKPKPDPASQQRWITFLRNHRDVIAGMDFFVVPTVRFHLLHVWFAIDHARRRVLHCNVTANPAARWVIQQLREAFLDEPSHRFLIFDNDAIFSAQVACSIGRLGIHPRRTAYRSPWQKGTAERFVGSARRELLDHVVVLGEDHLRRLLREYVAYYNTERVHTSIGDAPANRITECRPSRRARVVGSPRIGGLHHRYAWREAAGATSSGSEDQLSRAGE